MNYIPLYVKSDYSILRSLITIESLISFAKENNIKTIALTDENSMSGVMEFVNKCTKNNIKPIVGLELEIDSKKILLYAKNYKGYQNLNKILTFKSEDKLNLSILKKYSSNLICIIPFKSNDFYDKLNEIYIDIYLGYETSNEKNKILEKTSKVVYINEVLSLTENEEKYLKYLFAVKDGKTKENLEDYDYKNKYLKTDNIKTEDIKTTLEIDKLCEKIEFPSINTIPKFKQNSKFNSDEYLCQLAKKGLTKRLDNKVTKKYADRLLHELKIIKELNYSDYFLIVSDYVSYAKKQDILVGPGRGSAAGSLVSYSLGITEVDPIKYNLIFERFLNPERITMPDIDIDFEDTRREEVIEYVKNKYGSKNVAHIITFGTMGAKQVIRDVGRIFEMPTKLLDRINNYIPNKANVSLLEVYKENSKLKEFINSSKELEKLFDISLNLENKKRHNSIHAAGIIISEEEIDNIAPLEKQEEGYVVGYTMNYLEALGLLKMDFLGLKNLTIIKNILNNIDNLKLSEINLEDEKTIDIFKKVNTSGIFQFEKEGMKNFLSKLKIRNFEEIVAAIALYRPGPMDNISLYIKNRNNSKPSYIHKDLEDILKPTYGIIIYQEQIMMIARKLASYTLGEADVLRRAMSKKKKEILEKEETKFIKRSIENGYSKNVAKDVYNMILKFANYGFNRAHSVSYSLIAFYLAYLKAHYPLYFLKELLNNAIGSEQKLKEYIYEARLLDIKIVLPDINISEEKFIIKDNNLIYPLSGIKSVGNITVKTILKLREEEKFQDFIDFVVRAYKNKINKKTIEKLIMANVFRSFGYNEQTLFNNLDNIINYAELVKDLDEDIVEKPIIEKSEEYSKNKLIENEYEAFGLYINNSPFVKHRKNNVSTLNYKRYFDKFIEICLKIERIKEIATKKNNKMAFITGSDEFNNVEIVAFPNVYEEINFIEKGEIYKIFGKVEKRNAKYQIILSKIEKI